MEHFEKQRNLLRQDIDSLDLKNVETLLSGEADEYHSFCKNPDNQNQYTRFYSVYEQFFLSIHANKSISQYVSLSKALYKYKRLKMLYNLLLYKLQNSSNLVVLKGPINLANGALLLGALEQLPVENRSKLTLCLLDYSHQAAQEICSYLKVRVIGLKEFKLFSLRLSVIESAVIHIEKKFKLPINVCYWSIAFGMISLFKSLKLSGHLGKTFFKSCKYAYPFSSQYLDFFVSGPGLAEFLSPDVSHIVIYNVGIQSRQITLLDSDRLKEEICQDLLKLKHDKKRKLWSSMARHEKLRDPKYIDLVKSLTRDHKKNSCYLLCGKVLESHFEEFLKPTSGGKYIGWVNIKKLASLLDFYVDPFPHGGGLSLLIALEMNIPCIIPIMQTNECSPSMIQAIIPHLARLHKEIPPDIIKIILPSNMSELHSAIEYLISQNNVSPMLYQGLSIIKQLMYQTCREDAKKALGFNG